MKLIHILIMILTITSCGQTNSSEVKGEIKSEEITHPVRLHYVQRSGMKYMIASAQFGESGVHIQNLTLDSLQVEFYKKELEK